jgi:hypothetical protein
MTCLEALRGETRISMQIITDNFHEVFQSGQDGFYILYLVQYQVSTMR